MVAKFIKPGLLLKKKYKIIQQIFTNNKSKLFLAEHQQLRYPVAIKILSPQSGQDSAKLNREAEALRVLSNAHNVQMLDYGYFAHENQYIPFIVFEFVAGESLARLIHINRRLNPLSAVRIGIQILVAIAEAHAKGIVHGDIKPENIMVSTPTGTGEYVKVVDYGASINVVDNDGKTKVFASPHYCSPEVQNGELPTPQSDIYSVGAVLYEALSGKRPAFDPKQQRGGRADTPFVKLNMLIPTDETLADIIDQAMNNDTEKRFPTALEFVKSLRQLELESLATFDLGDFTPGQDAQEINTVEVAELKKPIEPKDTVDSMQLLSTEQPTVWVCKQDPAVDNEVVEKAIVQLQKSCSVVHLDETQRQSYLKQYQAGKMMPPWVVLFGDMHVLLQDSLLSNLASSAETSRVLISTHKNFELLQTTVNAVGVHCQMCLPQEPKDIADNIQQMIYRARKIRHRYDSIRLAVRDANEDIKNLSDKLNKGSRSSQME